MRDIARGDARLKSALAQEKVHFVEWLGRGAHAFVAKARHAGGVCALKVGERRAIHDEFASSRGFSHPALITADSLIDGDSFAALVMPFFEGETFASAVRTGMVQPAPKALRQNLPMAFGYELSDLGASPYAHCGDVGEARLRRWLPLVGDALSAMHQSGHVHMDIAPENILARGESVGIVDFGLVRRHDAPPADLAIGSAAYLAPELGLGRCSPAADWYSLGVVVFRALTGGLPFEGGGPEVLIRKQSMIAPRATELCAEVAADLDSLCAGLLERDPKKRRSSVV